MGECSDFWEGEPVLVTVPFDPPHSLALAGRVTWVWDEFIDVAVDGSDTIVRFPRQAADCAGLEVGEPATFEIGSFEQHFTQGEYDPEEEASHAE